MDKELKIIPPEGYEVDKENSTFECIKFKLKKSSLPTTWKEFCINHSIKPGECYISSGVYSNIVKYNYETSRTISLSKNVLPSLEYAEAVLALCQLIQLRDCYNDNWEPDWKNSRSYKYTIYSKCGNIAVGLNDVVSRVLAFKTKELRDTFLENFKDLIETAKPLL